MKSYVNPVHLVTTTDGKCPEGFVEVEMVAPWLRSIQDAAKTLDAFERAIGKAREDCEMFGTGVIKMLPNGTVEHVPLEEFRFGYAPPKEGKQ